MLLCIGSVWCHKRAQLGWRLRTKLSIMTFSTEQETFTVSRSEAERAYLRILSQSIIEHVRNGCQIETAMDTGNSADGRLDLSKSGREFITEDLARMLLEPMLKKGELYCSHNCTSHLCLPATNNSSLHLQDPLSVPSSYQQSLLAWRQLRLSLALSRILRNA
jgi:hypothetical protein